jgi:hypothetical protein
MGGEGLRRGTHTKRRAIVQWNPLVNRINPYATLMRED